MNDLSADGPLNILVVDDQGGIRVTLKGILGKRGYKVSVAESGEEAVEAAKKENFHLILMDIKMPGISGVEAFSEIKKSSPQASVILMTAYAIEDQIRQAIQEGVFTVIYKPFDIEKVLGVIADCLDKRDLVLVVDDRVEDQQLIGSILQSKGFRVGQATSGEECLQKVAERKFQVVLMDIRLPGMDGIETLDRLMKVRPGIGVIVVTALTREDLMQEALKRGSIFIRKPFHPNELLSAIQTSLAAGGIS